MTDRRPPPRPRRRIRAAGAAVAALAALSAGAASASDTIVSGSVYVDHWGFPDRLAAPRAPRGVTPAASLKIQVDVNDDLSFSAKACASCHGFDLEHVLLDFTPHPKFNVQAGRIAVPFGEFSQRVDPSGHRTASAPLIWDMGRMAHGERTGMNLGIVPQPYTDTGVLLYGVTWLGEKLQVWYGLYGVAGLEGSNDIDWMAMRSGTFVDNNREPAGGARVAVSYAADAGGFVEDLSFGGSFSGGRYDRDATRRYAMWGADATLRVSGITLRGEYAARRTDLDPDARYRFEVVDPWFSKEGWYAELEHPLGRYVGAVYRYDELRRSGVPLPGAAAELSTDSRIARYTAGLVVTPVQSLFVKLGWELWDPTDFAEFHSFHVGMGGAF